VPIEQITFSLPSVLHTAADLALMSGADETFIREKVGVSQRYVLGPDETGIDLASQACRYLFERVPDLSDQVDLLICVTETPDRRIPFNAAGIVTRLGLPRNVASFDVALGCSGYVYGVKIAESFLAGAGLSNAVLVTCDPYSRIIDPSDKSTNCVFGDAATATWISREGDGGRMVAWDFGTDGSQGDAIAIPKGGAAYPLMAVLSDKSQLDHDDLRLHMNGRGVFNFVNSVVPTSIAKCLEAADKSVDEVDLFALHQGSTYMLDAMARRARLPPNKVLKNMSKYGNTVSSSIPLLLAEAQQDSPLLGKTVLMSGFGVGLSWATALVEF